WGFASPDSDYDIRFIFARSATAYLGITPQDDTINVMDGNLDFSGWDVRKNFALLQKGNVAALEWLASPTVYRECASALKNSANDLYRPEGALGHYYGLARKTYEKYLRNQEWWNVKKTLYVLRGLFCCMWVEADAACRLPPLDFMTVARSVCDEDRMAIVILLLEAKTREDESWTIHKKDLMHLEPFILDRFEHHREKIRMQTIAHGEDCQERISQQRTALDWLIAAVILGDV
ncbi:YcgL, partial [Acidithiobacillus sp. GGI-221]